MNKRVRFLVVVVIMALLAMLVPVGLARAQGVDSFTIVVLPDTQNYVTSDEGVEFFEAQVDWILAERAASNLVFVSHEGDIANDPSDPDEWDRVEGALSPLDAADMPYGLAPGNHDIEPGGAAPEFDARFGLDRFAGKAWFGGAYAPTGTRATYQTITAGGRELLFIHVRHLLATFGEVAPVLEWVGQVLDDHPEHLAFVTTHEFTDPQGDIAMPALHDVLADRCNVAAVFSGHRFGAAHGTFDDACGRAVLHVLTNYQGITNGGEGYLRLVEVDPLTLYASLSVYSPVLGSGLSGPSEEFPFALARPIPPGDVSCDGDMNVDDALRVMQFAVGTRFDHPTCPLADPTSQLFASRSDTNGDDVVDVQDALTILQCSVGQIRPFCD